MELKEILEKLKEIETELVELMKQLEGEDANVDEIEEKSNKLIAERERLLEEKRKLEDLKQKRTALLDKIATGKLGTIIREPKDKGRAMEDTDKLYRCAWLKRLQGKELTAEERSAFQHTTENSNAIIPKETAEKIYSALGETHPIVADVKKIRSKGIFRMIRHTEIVQGDAKVVAEGKANEDEQNNFVEVILAGKKISKHIRVSYELMNMSIDSFESYLIDEIAKRMEKAMATSIIATIKDAENNDNGKGKGVHSDNIVTADAGLTIEKVLTALSKLNEVGTTFVYANRADIYGSIATLANKNQTVNFIANLNEAVKGNLLGNGIKQEDALAKGEILILDPMQFIWNEVSPLEIIKERNATTGDFTIAGHMLGDGALENQKAAALIKVTGVPSL